MSDEQFDRLLDHFEQPHHRGRMAVPTQALEIANPLCGDQVRLEVRVVEGVVQEAWFTGQGCIVSQSAASQLTEYLEGRRLEELRSFLEPDMLRLLGVTLTPTRQRCALLAWSAWRAILAQLSVPPASGS